MNLFKKATLATVLGATALTAVATPAMARPYDRHRSDSTGAAVAGGIIGLALGAIIASSANNHHDRYADRGWQWRDGYYWDGEGRRYDRNGRYDEGYYERRGYNGQSYGRGYGNQGYYGGGNWGGNHGGGYRGY